MGNEKKQGVVVTTSHRGVFFGYLEEELDGGKTVVISNVRNCISWTSSIRGFVGLAATGPNAECRVSPSAPRMKLQYVTGAIECSEEAVAAWEKGPWS